MGTDTLLASATAGDSDAKAMTADYRLNIDDDGTKVESEFPGDDDIEFHDLVAKAEGMDDICTILHSESMSGNAERVRFIVRAYADKNILGKLDSNKETALHVAVDCGHADVVEVLIEAARRLSTSSIDDDPDNQITCFEEFIRHPNDSMNTALHLAVRNGDMAIAKRLVEADSNDRHIQNNKGETPIYLAAKLGSEEMVTMLCEACTAPGLAGPHGTTALHAAILMLTEGKNEGQAVIAALINAAKTSASSGHTSYSSIRSFLRQSTKDDKDTALHLAVRRNHLDVVEHIIRADPSFLIKNDRTDFKSTIYKVAEQGYTDMVTLLCKRYDEVQNNLLTKGQTALCAAIIGRDTESVKSILRSTNRLVTYVDEIGWTPLHYAAYHEFDSILKTIVEAQTSVKYDVVYEKKIPTPLCVAAKEGYTSTLTRLMELLPDSIIVANCEDQNILHLAAIQNNKEMVQRILRHCPQKYMEKIFSDRDINGNTPLHLLVSQGCFIPGIMDNKKWPVDLMTTNNINWTPADMLYFQEEVIGDQLRYKLQVGGMQATTQRRGKFWRRSSTKESPMPVTSTERSSTRQSLVPRSKRIRKDAKFKMARKELIKKYAERSKEMANTQVVISALITTITFTVGFTVPGGLHQSGETDQGFAVLSKKTAFRSFMISDTLAFFLSTYSLFQYYFESYDETVSSIMLTSLTKTLNLFSIIAMLITFISGTYVVLSHSPPLANTIVIIGVLFFLQIIVMMIKFVLDRKDEEIDQE